MLRSLSFLVFALLVLSTCSNQQKSVDPAETNTPDNQADSSLVSKVKRHVDILCHTSKPRNYQNIGVLDSIASYIFSEFSVFCDTTYYQEFEVNGKIYRNVIGVLNPGIDEVISIGAHYDVCEHTPGADDNASGIAGLIESGRLLAQQKTENHIELVAFTLEEPPFFRTKDMGSYHYAKNLKKNKVDFKYMVCLEMIGYFDDQENTQEYPLDAMKQQYGTQGNFLAIVENEKQNNIGKACFDQLKKFSSIRYEYVQAPSFMTGVDFSDHLSFWKLGLKAFMITDTSFYRNKHYHKKSDKPELLNYSKIALFIVDFVKTF